MITQKQILPLHGLSQNFHAHVYFDDDQLEQALRCYRAIEASFPDLKLGRVHEALVGPHLKRQFQIALDRGTVADFLIWLDDNRGPMSVLVHPLTVDEVQDHTTHALWLGDKLPLKLGVLGAPNPNA